MMIDIVRFIVYMLLIFLLITLIDVFSGVYYGGKKLNVDTYIEWENDADGTGAIEAGHMWGSLWLETD